jgi:hypothetical protein
MCIVSILESTKMHLRIDLVCENLKPFSSAEFQVVAGEKRSVIDIANQFRSLKAQGDLLMAIR